MLNNTDTSPIDNDHRFHYLWLVAAGLATLAAFFGALGDNLIKLSFTKESISIKNGNIPTSIFCRPLWFVGMCCIIILNTSLTLTSYSLADASLLIPFSGLHIIFNMIFAYNINNECFSWKQVAFSLTILMGVTLVLVGGNHSSVVYSMDEIMELFGNRAFIIASVFVSMFVVGIVLVQVFSHNEKLLCLTTSMLCGAVGSFTQLFAKTFAEALDAVFNGQKPFKNPVPYIAIITTVIFGVTQFTLLNRALSRYNAFVVSPFVNSTLIVIGSCYSAIFFEEWKRFSVLSWVLLPMGIACTSLGVCLLAFNHDPSGRAVGGYRNSLTEDMLTPIQISSTSTPKASDEMQNLYSTETNEDTVTHI